MKVQDLKVGSICINLVTKEELIYMGYSDFSQILFTTSTQSNKEIVTYHLDYVLEHMKLKDMTFQRVSTSPSLASTASTPDTILAQKQIADEILDCIYSLSPYSILAGGAVADWYFGNPARDLDLYFTAGARTVGITRAMLKRLLPENISEITVLGEREDHRHVHDKNLYKQMPGLKRIWEFTYEGQEIQLIEMLTDTDIFSAIDKMSASVCKALYSSRPYPIPMSYRSP